MNRETTSERIRDLDAQIVELFNQRAEAATDLTASDVVAGEASMWRLVEECRRDPLTKESLREIYGSIHTAFRVMASTEPISVAYLGPPGTFTHMAARDAFGAQCDYDPLPDVKSVFDAVEARTARYGVVARVNSIHGPTYPTLDLLAARADREDERRLNVCGEIVLPITPALLGRGEIKAIKVVCSHEQALYQCQAHLRKLEQEIDAAHLELRPAPSTSAATKEAADDSTETIAAIAPRLAGKWRGLNVLRDHMEDDPSNRTRFVILGHDRPARTGQARTLIWFGINHEAGALGNAFAPLSERGLSMTEVHSRPVVGALWAYSFFVEFAGHVDEGRVQEALEGVKAACGPGPVKILGSYPEGRLV